MALEVWEVVVVVVNVAVGGSVVGADVNSGTVLCCCW